MAAATRPVELQLLEAGTLLSAVTAGDDSLSVAEDSAVVLLDVLANGTPAGMAVTNVQSSPNADARVVYTSRGFRVAYQPAPDLFGADSFTDTAIDAAENTARKPVPAIEAVDRCITWRRGPS